MVHAVMSQFPTLEQVEIKKFSFIKDKAELINILDLAKDRSAVVVTTLALKEYQSAGKAYAMEKGILMCTPKVGLKNLTLWGAFLWVNIINLKSS
ncbi:hypothetical protein DOS63_11400 [Staphylococcus felis]|nr:hypothetical protein DOS63_11400 [Staphylococcus felis]